jgi:hypothetical protein
MNSPHKAEQRRKAAGYGTHSVHCSVHVDPKSAPQTLSAFLKQHEARIRAAVPEGNISLARQERMEKQVRIKFLQTLTIG